MKLRLMTPDGALFEGDVLSVRGRAPGGEFEILPGHAPWVSPLEICLLALGRLSADAQAGARCELGMSFAVHGGLIEVGADAVLVLADLAEAPGDIDLERAERAARRARERLSSGLTEDGGRIDADRARRALARALVRIDSAGGR